MPSPSYLYKFLTPERVDVLDRQLIRFTQPSALNDPFELQPMFEHLFPENQLDDALTPTFDMIEESLRQKWSGLSLEQQQQVPVDAVIEFLRENPLIIEGLLTDIFPSLKQFVEEFTPCVKELLAEALQSKVGILSLSEDPTHPLLWAHYAQSHKGFAIEFDTTHAFFNRRRSETDELYHLRKVIYADRSMKGRALTDLDGDDVLVTKASPWSYEAEWRMLVPLDDANEILTFEGDTIYLFGFPADAVSGIVLGTRSSEELGARIVRQLGSSIPHAGIMRATLNGVDQQIVVTPWEPRAR